MAPRFSPDPSLSPACLCLTHPRAPPPSQAVFGLSHDLKVPLTDVLGLLKPEGDAEGQPPAKKAATKGKAKGKAVVARVADLRSVEIQCKALSLNLSAIGACIAALEPSSRLTCPVCTPSRHTSSSHLICTPLHHTHTNTSPVHACCRRQCLRALLYCTRGCAHRRPRHDQHHSGQWRPQAT